MVGFRDSPRAFQLVRGCARDDSRQSDDSPGSQLPSDGLRSLQLFPQSFHGCNFPVLKTGNWLSGYYLCAMAYALSVSIF